MTKRLTGLELDPFDNDVEVDIGESRALGMLLVTKPYEHECPAELALRCEGISHAVCTVKPSKSYGEQPEQYAGIIVTLWQLGEGFINVEHDVVPWPGALDQLAECPEPLCYFPYPTWPIGRFTKGIGCMKFGEEVMKTVPNSWESWGNIPWWDLDGALLSDLKEAGFEPHKHSPPVAHIRKPLI